jgi:hypothetical protein
VAAALALGACGGGDENGGGETGAADSDTTINTGPADTTATDTGTTGTTEGERTATTGEDRTTTGEGGGDEGGGNSGRGSDGSGGDGGGQRRLSPPGKDVQSVARRVCNQFLPVITARQLEEGKTTPQKVATDYARAYPKRHQKRVYEGCLKGLDDRGVG